jgi:transcriptional regulator GlxA family with amidase domain
LFRQWRQQPCDHGLAEASGSSARILGVCAGALVVGRAGLLDGRRCTASGISPHLPSRHPSYLVRTSYVIDGSVADHGRYRLGSDMLALVEAIGGHEKRRRSLG